MSTKVSSRTIIIIVIVAICSVVLICSLSYWYQKQQKSSIPPQSLMLLESKKVQELSSPEEIIPFLEQKESPRIVMIYLPKCIHCIRMMSEVEKLSDELGEANVKKISMPVYYSKPPKSLNLPSIRGVPSFLYKSLNGTMKVSTGYTTKDTLMKLILDKQD